MYRTTGDSSYLDYAEGAARWVESVANKTHGLRFAETDSADTSTELSTRWTFGSPGIGGFFIDLYIVTDNVTYAGWANQTAEGLIYNALADEGGYSWTHKNGNTDRYVGRWHGAAGIATFFMEMYDRFSNATYLQYAEGIATWIDSTHEEDQGYFYPDNNAVLPKSYKLGGWSRSSAGIGSMFLRLYQRSISITLMRLLISSTTTLLCPTKGSHGQTQTLTTELRLPLDMVLQEQVCSLLKPIK
jgi:hypothetical protein